MVELSAAKPKPLMETHDFSMERLLRVVEGARTHDGLAEAQIMPTMFLVYGGRGERLASGDGEPQGGASLQQFIAQQRDALKHDGGLKSLRSKLQQERRGAASDLVVTIESAVPGDRPLSICSVARSWMHRDQHLPPDLGDGADVAKGSEQEFFLGLWALDFLTLAPGSGVGAAACRTAHFEMEAGSRRRFSAMRFCAHFGARDADVVKKTHVMRHFMNNRSLGQLPPAFGNHYDATAVADAEMLFQAAATCFKHEPDDSGGLSAELATLFGVPAQSHDEWMRFLHHRTDDKHDEHNDEHIDLDTSDAWGVEFYECAVKLLLQGMSSDSAEGASPAASERAPTLTVIEVMSYSPPFGKPKDPCLTSVAGVTLELWHRRLVFNWRWYKHLGGGVGGDAEEVRRAFESCDVHGEGAVSLGELELAIRNSDEALVMLDLHRKSDAKEFFKKLDADGDYRVTWQEFFEECCNQKKLKWAARDDRWIRLEENLRGKVAEEDLAIHWRTDFKHAQDIRRSGLKARGTTEVWDWTRLAEVAGPGTRRLAQSLADQKHEAEKSVGPIGEALAEIFREADSTVAIKIVYDLPHDDVGGVSSFSAAEQLCLLDLPQAVAIWRRLFPYVVSADEDRELRRFFDEARCREFMDYVIRGHPRCFCLSPEAWRKWSERQVERQAPPLPLALIEGSSPRASPRASSMASPGPSPGRSIGASPGASPRNTVLLSESLLYFGGPSSDGPRSLASTRPAPPSPLTDLGLWPQQCGTSPATSSRTTGAARLRVRVVAARGLQRRSEGRSRAPPSPYVVVRCADVEGRTVKIDDDASPVWPSGAELCFDVQRGCGVPFDIEVIDVLPFRSECIGVAHVCADARPGVWHSSTSALSRGTGEIDLQVRVDLPEGPAGVAEEVSASPVPEAPLLGAAVCARQPWTACAGADLAAVAEGLRHSPDMFHEDGLSPSIAAVCAGVCPIVWFSASRLHLLRRGGLPALSVLDDPKASAGATRPGVLGDGWLVAAVEALADFPRAIQDVFEKCAAEPHRDADGPYELMLHDPRKLFQRVPVSVNDRVPCFRNALGYWQPLFASTPRRELWPMLLEKAVAKLLGGYERFDGNRPPLAWAVLTGSTAYRVYFPWRSPPGGSATVEQARPGDFWGEGEFRDLDERPSDYVFRRAPDNVHTSERIWESLRLTSYDHKVMACVFHDTAADGALGGGVPQRGLEAGDGLLAGRPYPLLGLLQVVEPSTGRVHRLVKLRNLWHDRFRWSGRWSGESGAWQEHPDVASAAGGADGVGDGEGLCWMSWEDFRSRVAAIYFSVETLSGFRAAVAREETCWSNDAQQERDAPDPAFGNPDLWQDFAPLDPDDLQRDLISWPDGFSDSPAFLDADAFPSGPIKWVSASRVHRFLRYAALDSLAHGAPPAQLAPYQARWVEIAARSGASAGAVCVCGSIDASMMFGSTGGQWLVTAVAALADAEWPLREVFAGCPKQPFDGRDGPYALALFDPKRGFKRAQLMLNDRVPCHARYSNRRDRAAGWRPCYSAAACPEMWPMLLEKGMAQLLGGYQALRAHRVSLAWAIITGETAYGALFRWSAQGGSEAATEAKADWGVGEFSLVSKDGRLRDRYSFAPRARNEHGADWVWERLRYMSSDSRLLACSFSPPSGTAAADGEAEEDHGLLAGLPYAIVGVHGVFDGSGSAGPAAASTRLLARRRAPSAGRGNPNGTEHRLIQLRSPLKSEVAWLGRWSMESGEWSAHPVVADAVGYRGLLERPEDGVFFMCWEDFRARAAEVVFSEASYVRPASTPRAGRAYGGVDAVAPRVPSSKAACAAVSPPPPRVPAAAMRGTTSVGSLPLLASSGVLESNDGTQAFSPSCSSPRTPKDADAPTPRSGAGRMPPPAAPLQSPRPPARFDAQPGLAVGSPASRSAASSIAPATWGPAETPAGELLSFAGETPDHRASRAGASAGATPLGEGGLGGLLPRSAVDVHPVHQPSYAPAPRFGGEPARGTPPPSWASAETPRPARVSAATAPHAAPPPAKQSVPPPARESAPPPAKEAEAPAEVPAEASARQAERHRGAMERAMGRGAAAGRSAGRGAAGRGASAAGASAAGVSAPAATPEARRPSGRRPTEGPVPARRPTRRTEESSSSDTSSAESSSSGSGESGSESGSGKDQDDLTSIVTSSVQTSVVETSVDPRASAGGRQPRRSAPPPQGVQPACRVAVTLRAKNPAYDRGGPSIHPTYREKLWRLVSSMLRQLCGYAEGQLALEGMEKKPSSESGWKWHVHFSVRPREGMPTRDECVQRCYQHLIRQLGRLRDLEILRDFEVVYASMKDYRDRDYVPDGAAAEILAPQGPVASWHGQTMPCQGPTMPCQGPTMPCQGPTMPWQGPATPWQGPATPWQGPAAPWQGAAAPWQGMSLEAELLGDRQPSISVHFGVSHRTGLVMSSGEFGAMLMEALGRNLNIQPDQVHNISLEAANGIDKLFGEQLAMATPAVGGAAYFELRPQIGARWSLRDLRSLQQRCFHLFGDMMDAAGRGDSHFARHFGVLGRTFVSTTIFPGSPSASAGEALIGSEATSRVHAHAIVIDDTVALAGTGVLEAARYSPRVAELKEELAGRLGLSMEHVRVRAVMPEDPGAVTHRLEVHLEFRPRNPFPQLDDLRILRQSIASLGREGEGGGAVRSGEFVALMQPDGARAAATVSPFPGAREHRDGEVLVIREVSAVRTGELSGLVGVEIRHGSLVRLATTDEMPLNLTMADGRLWARSVDGSKFTITKQGVGNKKGGAIESGDTVALVPQGDATQMLHFRIERGGMGSLVPGSLVVDSTIRHVPNWTLAPSGGQRALCCHVEIASREATTAGLDCLSEWLRVGILELGRSYSVRDVALEFHSTPRPTGRSASAPPGPAAPTYNVDFTVKVANALQAQQVHEMLCALDHQETKDWGIRNNLDIFTRCNIASAARFCAGQLCASAGSRPGSIPMPSSMGSITRHTFFGIVDVVDLHTLVKHTGAGHFAAVFADAVHIVAGVSPTQLSILDVQPLDTTRITLWPARWQSRRSSEEVRPRYRIVFEVRLAPESPSMTTVQRVYEGIAQLHSLSVMRRWAGLPFLDLYTLEGGGEIIAAEFPQLRPDVPMSRLCAHIDLVDFDQAEPFFVNEPGVNVPGDLVGWFLDALELGLNIPRRQVVVTSIRLRPGHAQRSVGFKPSPKNWALKLNEKWREFEVAPNMQQFAQPPAGTSFTVGRDLARPEEHSMGYSIDFEVFEDSMPQGWLEQARKSLRMFHSDAVARQIGSDSLLMKFRLDSGMQVDEAPGLRSGRPQEQHLYPALHEGGVGPMLLSGTAADKGSVGELFRGHCDFIQLPDRMRLGKELPTGLMIKFFLEAVHFTWRDEGFGKEHPSEIVESDEPGVLPIVYIRLKPRHWDGILFEVRGVSFKGAHHHALATQYLRNSQCGVQEAHVLDDHKGYCIDFSISRTGDGAVGAKQAADLADEFRDFLHMMAIMRPPPTPSSGPPFFQHYMIDRGVHIDSMQPHGQVMYSMRPYIVRGTMRLISAGRPDGVGAQELVLMFPRVAARMLGTYESQVKVDQHQGNHGHIEIHFEVKTLQHSPAENERAALTARFIALNQQAVQSSRWWTRAFPAWQIVSVQERQGTATPSRDPYSGVLAFTLTLEDRSDPASVQPEELLADVAARLGVARGRLELRGDLRRGSVKADLQVTDFRSFEECLFLKSTLAKLAEDEAAPLEAWGGEFRFGRHRLDGIQEFATRQTAIATAAPAAVGLRHEAEDLRHISLEKLVWKFNQLREEHQRLGRFPDVDPHSGQIPKEALLLCEIREKLVACTGPPDIDNTLAGRFSWACLSIVEAFRRSHADGESFLLADRDTSFHFIAAPQSGDTGVDPRNLTTQRSAAAVFRRVFVPDGLTVRARPGDAVLSLGDSLVCGGHGGRWATVRWGDARDSRDSRALDRAIWIGDVGVGELRLRSGSTDLGGFARVGADMAVEETAAGSIAPQVEHVCHALECLDVVCRKPVTDGPMMQPICARQFPEMPTGTAYDVLRSSWGLHDSPRESWDIKSPSSAGLPRWPPVGAVVHALGESRRLNDGTERVQFRRAGVTGWLSTAADGRIEVLRRAPADRQPQKLLAADPIRVVVHTGGLDVLAELAASLVEELRGWAPVSVRSAQRVPMWRLVGSVFQALEKVLKQVLDVAVGDDLWHGMEGLASHSEASTFWTEPGLKAAALATHMLERVQDEGQDDCSDEEKKHLGHLVERCVMLTNTAFEAPCVEAAAEDFGQQWEQLLTRMEMAIVGLETRLHRRRRYKSAVELFSELWDEASEGGLPPLSSAFMDLRRRLERLG